MHLGMVGLGKMGMNMSRRLVDTDYGGGHDLVAYTRNPEKVKEAEGFGAKGAASLEELVGSLQTPRIVWVMVPAGKPTEETIEGLSGFLEEGDIIIDGGNTYYKDDIGRSEKLKDKGIDYVDVGTSGGIWGLTEGYCLMVGGEEKTFNLLEPIFETLAPPRGYLYCGPVGSGHYVKMIHNGIEYALMESYAEGFELMKASPYGDGLDLSQVAALWNRGSVVRSWLLELVESALKKDGDLVSIKGYVEDSGEGRWTVNEAVERGVSIPAISAALFRRFRSRQDDSFGEKVLAALRNEFGGHGVKSTGKPGKDE